MSIAAVIKFAAVAAQTGQHGPYQPLPARMDYVVYLTERALEFRNLALTTRDAAACQALHHLADLCAAKAAALAASDEPISVRAKRLCAEH